MKKTFCAKSIMAWIMVLVMGINGICLPNISAEAATKKVKVSSVKLNYKNYTLKKGKKLKLKATISPSKAKKIGVTWKSSKKSVATVDSKGVVKGIKNGKVTITATAKGSKKKATCKVIVGTPVSKVIVDQKSITLTQGEKKKIVAKVEPAKASNKKVEYQSSDEKVVTVSSAGELNAKGVGSATIKVMATDGSKKAATVTVVVKQKQQTTTTEGKSEAKPEVKPEMTTEEKMTPKKEKPSVRTLSFQDVQTVMKEGESQQLDVVVNPSNAADATVEYASDDEDVLLVSSTGLVKACGEGVAKITANTKNGTIASVYITVGKEATGISLDQSAFDLSVEKSKKLCVTIEPADATNKRIFWTSDNENVATVDKYGKVTAKAAGKAIITATTTNRKKAVCEVSVVAAIRSLSLSKTSSTIGIGTRESLELVAMVNPVALADSVVWSSDNEAVATVSNTGVVNGVAAGTTKINAQVQDKKVSCTITVGNRITVNNQKALMDLLSAGDVNQIIYKTTAKENIEIAAGIYDDIELVVDAPNATITNYANFRKIEIRNISQDTWIEKATGNLLDLVAETPHVIVEGLNVSIQVNQGVQSIKLENNGSIAEIDISTPSKVDISGENKSIIPVVSVAADVVIKTSVPVQLDTVRDVKLNIEPGAESSSITVADEDVEAEVTGIGVIPVTNKENGEVFDVVAENTLSKEKIETLEKGNVNGQVVNENEDGIKDVVVSIIPYVAGYTDSRKGELIAAAKANENYMECKTDENGDYQIDNISYGNYLFIYQANGLKDGVQTVVLNQSSVTNDVLVLHAVTEQVGVIQGILHDASDIKTVAAGIDVYVRVGADTVTGDVLQTTKTDENGGFVFDKLPVGTYTVQIVDNRNNVEKKYACRCFNVTVSENETVKISKVLSVNTENEQIRFVLTWKERDWINNTVPSDLDSHLIGIMPDGTKFHNYGMDAVQWDGSQKIVAIDEMGLNYGGPETTTIYNPGDGIYRFIVHNCTDSEDRNSTRLSTSGAVVKVFRGNQVIATYNVPSGKGTQWDVCSYDAKNRLLTSINTIRYVTSDMERIGVEDEDVELLKLRTAKNQFEYAANLVLNKKLGEEVERTIIEKEKEFRKIVEQSTNEDEIKRLSGELIDYYLEAKNSVNVYARELDGRMGLMMQQSVVAGEEIDGRTVDYSTLLLEVEYDNFDLNALEYYSYYEGTTVKVTNSDVKGYEKKLIVTNPETKAYVEYYVKVKEYIPDFYHILVSTSDKGVYNCQFEGTNEGEETTLIIQGEFDTLVNPRFFGEQSGFSYKFNPVTTGEKNVVGYLTITYKNKISETVKVVYEKKLKPLQVYDVSSKTDNVEWIDNNKEYYMIGDQETLTDDLELVFDTSVDVSYHVEKDPLKKNIYYIKAKRDSVEEVLTFRYQPRELEEVFELAHASSYSLYTKDGQYAEYVSAVVYPDGIVLFTDHIDQYNDETIANFDIRSNYGGDDKYEEYDKYGTYTRKNKIQRKDGKNMLCAYRGDKLVREVPIFVQDDIVEKLFLYADNEEWSMYPGVFRDVCNRNEVKKITYIGTSKTLENPHIKEVDGATFTTEDAPEGAIGMLHLDHGHQQYDIPVYYEQY